MQLQVGDFHPSKKNEYMHKVCVLRHIARNDNHLIMKPGM